MSAGVSERGRESGGQAGERGVRSPRETQFPDLRTRLFSPSFPCCSRKSPRTFFFDGDFLFLFSISSVHCRRTKRATFRSIRSKWPARSFPLFPRMNFRRRASRKTRVKIQSCEIKVSPSATAPLSRKTLEELLTLEELITLEGNRFSREEGSSLVSRGRSVIFGRAFLRIRSSLSLSLFLCFLRSR